MPPGVIVSALGAGSADLAVAAGMARSALSPAAQFARGRRALLGGRSCVRSAMRCDGDRCDVSPHRTLGRALACVLPLLVAGDIAVAQPLPVPRVRDSAGVRIVEYASIKTSVPAFAVASAPPRVLGGLRDDPEEEIEGRTAYRSSVSLSGGHTAVAEWSTVRVLDESGRFVRVLGGRGSAPGLFHQQIILVCRLAGDSLMVVASDRRISVFSPTGTHVRSATADGFLHRACGPNATLVGNHPITSSEPSSPAAPGPARLELFRVNSNGRFGDRIGVFETTYIPVSVVRDNFTVAFFGETMYADNGSRPEIKAYSLSGELKAVIRWRDPLVAVTPAIVAELARGTPAAQLGWAGPRQRPHFPAYTRFSVDRVGRVWLADFWPVGRPAGRAPGYTVFSATGVLLGRFDVPIGDHHTAVVTDAGEDYALVQRVSRTDGVSILRIGITPVR